MAEKQQQYLLSVVASSENVENARDDGAGFLWMCDIFAIEIVWQRRRQRKKHSKIENKQRPLSEVVHEVDVVAKIAHASHGIVFRVNERVYVCASGLQPNGI